MADPASAVEAPATVGSNSPPAAQSQSLSPDQKKSSSRRRRRRRRSTDEQEGEEAIQTEKMAEYGGERSADAGAGGVTVATAATIQKEAREPEPELADDLAIEEAPTSPTARARNSHLEADRKDAIEPDEPTDSPEGPVAEQKAMLHQVKPIKGGSSGSQAVDDSAPAPELEPATELPLEAVQAEHVRDDTVSDEEEDDDEAPDEEEEEEEEKDDDDGNPFPIPHRRPSIEKKPVVPKTTAFARLPDEIIQQILHAADPGSFASLVLLNPKWNRVSQQSDLYALQLSRCTGSTAAAAALQPPILTGLPDGQGEEDEDEEEAWLRRLRRRFGAEIKRNLFAAYLRPAETAVRLISHSISSSSCPGGEGMQFSPSPRGHCLLAYNSSRIYVLDVRGRPEHMVRRELKISRRPASTCITDDGQLLAVLSTEIQVDLYELRHEAAPRRRQSLILDHSPRAIALSPCGSVLAAACEGGIEVTSVSPGALPTERRAVKCDAAVDSLAFSFDGTQLLGTTAAGAASPSTVVLTAPYYDPGSSGLVEDGGGDISPLWTTSILFPNTSRDCSHAVLLQQSAQEEASWTFAYDRSFETFRAVRIDDLRNGTTYFTGPVPSDQAGAASSLSSLLPSTLPAATYHGELVAAGFEGRDIWLYGVPEDLDAPPPPPPPAEAGSEVATPLHPPPLQRSNSRLHESGGICSGSGSSSNAGGGRVPQWQVLCDKFRNNFVAGRRLGELEGVSMVKWVCGGGRSSGGASAERLVVAARGVVPNEMMPEEGDIDWVDGGRISLFDFGYGSADGIRRELTIEVGICEPEMLEEERRDMATEVAIVRRRTVAQRRGDRTSLLRAATTATASSAAAAAATTTATTATSTSSNSSSSRLPPLPTVSFRLSPASAATDRRNGPNHRHRDNSSDVDEEDDPLVPRRFGPPMLKHGGNSSADANESPASPTPTEDFGIDEAEALDLPYSHASPRSGPTLRRAATAAAANRRRQPEPPASGRPVEYRRADGRREHPHESDGDNWVPPPPPYQRDAPSQDLPAFLRAPAVGPGGSLVVPRVPGSPHPLTPLTPQMPQAAPAAPRDVLPPLPLLPPLPPLPRLPPPPPQTRSPAPSSAVPWRDVIRLHRRSMSGSRVMSVSSSGASAAPAASSPPPQPMSSSSAAWSSGRAADGGNNVDDEGWLRQDDVSPPESPRASLRHSSYVPASPPFVVSPTDTRPDQQQWQQQRVAIPSPVMSLVSPIDRPLPPLPADAPQRIRQASGSGLTTLQGSPIVGAARHRPMPQRPAHAPSPSMPTASSWAGGQDHDHGHVHAHAHAHTLSADGIPEEAAGPIHFAASDMADMPAMPRLSSIPTWPLTAARDHRRTQAEAVPQHGEPGQTLASSSVHDLVGFALPPPPRPDQLASLERHHERGTPRRLSRELHIPRARFTQDPESRPSSSSDYDSPASFRSLPGTDLALIISTPGGVSGAFDDEGPAVARGDPPILAPVARRAPASGGNHPHSRPTVERLETIYSNVSGGGQDGNGAALMLSSSSPCMTNAGAGAAAAAAPAPDASPAPPRHRGIFGALWGSSSLSLPQPGTTGMSGGGGSGSGGGSLGRRRSLRSGGGGGRRAKTGGGRHAWAGGAPAGTPTVHVTQETEGESGEKRSLGSKCAVM